MPGRLASTAFEPAPDHITIMMARVQGHEALLSPAIINKVLLQPLILLI